MNTANTRFAMPSRTDFAHSGRHPAVIYIGDTPSGRAIPSVRGVSRTLMADFGGIHQAIASDPLREAIGLRRPAYFVPPVMLCVASDHRTREIARPPFGLSHKKAATT